MKSTYAKYIPLLIVAVLAIGIVSCSTKNNTSQSRWWHSFNAKYNTYYNGAQAYIEGSLEKENGNKDNFTEMIPLYTVGNKNSKDLGKGNFERAIEKAEKAIARHSIKRKPEWNKHRKKTVKDIEWLSRREYNPFLWKAWMLMGRSQFYKGSFEDAATTFAYMSRLYKGQSAIYGKARAWLAKSYIEAGWLYDAEDVIRNMQRDSVDWHAVKEWDYTYADYYIHTGELEKAVPYLRKVIKYEMRKKQKAREWYLMGQIQAALGNKEAAHNAFKHVIHLNPPYELEFNARIAATEVMATGQSKQMISRLKRMAASDNNKEYLDQVYYAMGNIYLAERDTMNAIDAYEQGSQKATRSGVEKGVLLLHLGDLYWAKERFGDARRCYNEALGLLDKDRKDYEQLSTRAKILDDLAPHTDAVQLQDSLQYLAKCSEKERFEAIDRVINALKKKEKEERDRLAEQEAAQRQSENGGLDIDNAMVRRPSLPNKQSDGTWYFYNPTAVQQGKTSFQQLWGKRENVDHWQRMNKTVVGGLNTNNNFANLTDAQRDSIAKEEAKMDSVKMLKDSAQNDPHKREYYLAQIPFSADQLAASNKILEEGLHKSGVIFKDRLDNLRLSEKALRRVSDNYPEYEQMDDVYYHLYLLYMRKNQLEIANTYISKLKASYPQSKWTAVLTDPYFKENAKFGEQIEDSLYAATYEAFKANRFGEVAANKRISDTRFPMGANRDKFLFIGGLSKLNEGDANGCLTEMKTVVEQYPQSRISEMAGMIVNGVQAGKKIRSGKFDLGDVWNYRTNILNDSDSIKQVKFSPDRDVDFKFLLVYHPDSLKENKLLFEMARFNFTSFYVRNFDIEIIDVEDIHQMQISGFRNFDEAYQYGRQLFNAKNVVEQLNKSARGIIISDKNLQLIGTTFSYKDYDDFYAKHFAPLTVTKRYLLSEPAEIAVPREEERDLQDEIESRNPTERDLNIKEKLENEVDYGVTIPMEQEPKVKVESPKTNAEAPNTELVIPTDDAKKGKEPVVEDNNGEILIPTDEPVSPNSPTEIIIPMDEQPKKAEPTKAETPVSKPQPPKPVEPNKPISNPQVSNTETETSKPVAPTPKVEPEKKELPVVPIDENTFEIPTDDEPNAPEGTFIIPIDEPKPIAPKVNNDKSKQPQAPKPANGKPTLKQQKGKTLQPTKQGPNAKKGEKKADPTKKQNTDGPVIYFEDEAEPAQKTEKKPEQQPVLDYDIEDEYYDLGGF